MTRRAPFVLLVAAAFLAAACHRDVASAPPATPGTDVLLVTIDTLRADRLGCYGHVGAATPVLDALAARGVRFSTAIAHAPLTGPSHGSILTGRTPVGHGLRDNGGFVLPALVKTAAEDFAAAGFQTAGFVSGFPLDRRFGFSRGFGSYDDHLPRGNDPRRTPYVERFADSTTEAAVRWLATPAVAAPAARRFLWVHYYDPHAPYEPPADLADRFRADPYDGEVAFVDRQVGRLLKTLEDQGRLARTVVLVTADHGESLGEHGEGTHGLFLYDATLRVPWIVAGPAISPRVSDVVARGIDVLPTLLDLSGQPRRAEIEGRTMRPALEGRAMDDAPTYAESLYSEREFGWAPLHAWRTARHKVIDAPRPELYDLVADPAEIANKAAAEGARVAELGAKIEAALARPAPAATVAVDPETTERLGALGYLGAGGGHPRGAGSLRDPKDGIRLMPRLNRGISAVRMDPPLAIRELSAVLAEDPGLLMARRSRAVAYASAGRHELAIADLRLLEKDGLLTADDGVVLGDNLRFAGRLAEAADVLQRTARQNPKFSQPWLSLAEIHVKRGVYDEAARSYERALEITPDHIEALRGLGDLGLIREDLGGAAARYERLLEVDPNDTGALTKLGVVRMRMGKPEEGRRLFERAVAREPKNAEALLYLAGALAAAGRGAEAVSYFERALAADPRSTMALNGLGLTRLGLGDAAGARTAFRQSLRLDPKQPEVVRTLAELGTGG